MSEDRLDLFEIVRDLAHLGQIEDLDKQSEGKLADLLERAHDAMRRPTEVQIEYRIGAHITHSLDDVWTAVDRFGPTTVVHRRRIVRMPWTVFQAPGRTLSAPGIETVHLPDTP